MPKLKLPRYLSAFRGRRNAVQLLLECNADIFLADTYNRTPVEIAKSARHKGIVDLIMEEGGRLLCAGAESGDVKLCRRVL
jgi:ankyrin repeat protein